VDLEARLVAEPGEAGGVDREQMVVGVAIGAAVDAGLVPALEPLRRCLRDVLLPETRGAGAVGEPLQVERPVDQVGKHGRGDRGEIADQLALGDRGVGLEQRLVEVGQLQVVAADLPLALLAEGARPASRPLYAV
jgi:hypothetical protein